MTRNQTKSGKNKSKEQLAFMRERKTGVPSRLKSPGAEQSREATNSADDGENLEAGESSHQRGEEQGSKSPSSLLFEPISPSFLKKGWFSLSHKHKHKHNHNISINK